MVSRMAEVFARGSTGELLMELAAKENLPPEEIERLRAIALSDGHTAKGDS
jgi:hypothetical protein